MLYLILQMDVLTPNDAQKEVENSIGKGNIQVDEE
jgi:hypothetical protein